MGYSADANKGSVLVMVEKDAAFGDYTIMVTNGKSGDAEVRQDRPDYIRCRSVRWSTWLTPWRPISRCGTGPPSP